jgi:carbonic anhydrase/acetyltransferase-like protein (isoleucine patch superfamily)
MPVRNTSDRLLSVEPSSLKEMIREFDTKYPQVDASAFVSEAAYVVGDVEIGEGTNIWPGAVIRGDCGKITIGKNTSIEDNCVVHGKGDVIIGNNVVVGHGAVVHGHSVGNFVLIGNNAVILNDAVIGAFSIIGAGSVVAEGMQIPQKSLCIGTPARIRGRVSSRQIEQIKNGVSFYIDLAQKYKRQGL